jgi:hypothetical protein
LSYVWGVPDFTECIVLDGHPFYVTPSLEEALRHLRHPTTSRTLWIDALSINQSNDIERSQQVPLMRSIYSKCTTDLFWLGPHKDNVIRGMEVTRLLQGADISAFHKQGWRYSSIPEKSWPTGQKTRGRSWWTLTPADWRALRCLFVDASIWSRVWVMQEISCAPHVVLICGKHELDWELVERILDADSTTHYTDAFHSPFSHDSDRLLSSTFANAQVVKNQRRFFRAADESTLLDVLSRFRKTVATNPRDKIYGLMGLANDAAAAGIVVDYRASPATVFTNVTTCLINAAANLDVVSQSFWPLSSEARNRRPDLPSWVPDYGATKTGKFLFAQRGIFCAGDASCRMPVVVSPPGTLSIDAISLGKISRIDVPSTARDGTYDAILGHLGPELATAYLTPAQLTGDEPYEPTGEPAFRALWRTLVVDCKSYPTTRLSASELDAAGGAFEACLTDLVQPHVWYDLGLHTQLMRVTTERPPWRFGVTERGYYALLPAEAGKGDEVFVLRGSKVPMVLREDARKGGWTVVGGCYVHGFMDGEGRGKVEDGVLKERVIGLV